MQETKEIRVSVPGSGRSPGGVHSKPLQYSGLENSMGTGSWQAAVHRVAESDMTETTSLSEQLEDFPGGIVVKDLPAKTGDEKDMESIPGSGRSLALSDKHA